METNLEKMLRNGIPEMLFTPKTTQQKDQMMYKNTLKQINDKIETLNKELIEK